MQGSLMCGIDWTRSGVETLSLKCFLIRVFFYTNVFRYCMWTQLSLTPFFKYLYFKRHRLISMPLICQPLAAPILLE